MSSILKALKKLEEEKSARRSDPVDIAGGIVRSGGLDRRPPRWRAAAAMVGVAAGAVLATYALMGGHGGRREEPPAAPAVARPPQEPVIPSSPPRGAAPAPQPAPQPQSPSRQPVAHPLPPGRSAAGMDERRPPPSPLPPGTPAAPAAEEVLRPPLQEPPPKSAAAVPPVSSPVAPARPSFSVTGIAWQKDGASRMAVVNGTAVSRGGRVGGARVEEIYPDRVRLSLDGDTFEVTLGGSDTEK